VASGKTGTGESPPLPRPRLGLACILVYRSLPQVVARKQPPPPPNSTTPYAFQTSSRDQVSIRHSSALWTPRLSIYDDSDGVQVLAHAAACSQRFDGISLVGICPFAILFVRTVRGRTLKPIAKNSSQP
jgi:hypothetical protein